MTHPMLRFHDGYDGTSPTLHDEVIAMQTLLTERGFPVEADGFFGPGTASAVKAFQGAHDLDTDGIVGPRTWAVLEGDAPPTDTSEDFPTTFAPSHPGLTAELATATGYRELAEAAAERYGLPLCVIAGVASRESGWGLMLRPRGPAGTGDATARAPRPPIRTTPRPPDGGGFGRGLMQIDYDSHPFARTGQWADPGANLMYGAGVLSQNRAYLGRSTVLTGVTLLHAALSAYNCGAGNVMTAVRRGLDLDFFTSGRDYGRDALNRAGWFSLKGWG